MRFRPAAMASLMILTTGLALSGCESATADDPMDLDALPRLNAVEEMRIGSVDDPDFGFSRITTMDVDREGRIYVLELVDREIRVYSPDGASLLHRIGGPGEGPGEFMGSPRHGVVGDTLWTYDSRNGRITLFDREGTLLSTGQTLGVRVPLWNSYGYVMPVDMLPGGLFISSLTRIASSRDDPELTTPPTDTIPVPRVLFDATGAVIDTIGWDPSPPPRMARPPAMSGGGIAIVELSSGRYIVPGPPTELDVWIALADGRIILDMRTPTTPDDAVFTITRLDLDRDTVYRRDLHYRPQRYASAQLDSIAIREARDGPAGSAGAAGLDEADIAAAARAIRGKMTFPELQPAIRSWHTGEDEALWLLRTGEDGPSRWLVLDPGGIPRGELQLPSAVRPVWSSGDTFWTVEPDELDVPWLVRYRLVEG